MSGEEERKKKERKERKKERKNQQSEDDKCYVYVKWSHLFMIIISVV
jgi:hypothetical protein